MWEHLLIATGAITAFYQGIKTIVDAYKYFVQNEKTVKRHVQEGMDIFNPDKPSSSKGKRRIQGKAGVKNRTTKSTKRIDPLEDEMPNSNAS